MAIWQERVARASFPERSLSLVQGQSGVAARLIELGGVKWFEGDVGDELVACARDTVEPMRARHGVDFEAWKWGDVHQVYWRHPLSTPERRGLDVGPVAVDGGSETLRNTGAGQ